MNRMEKEKKRGETNRGTLGKGAIWTWTEEVVVVKDIIFMYLGDVGNGPCELQYF